MAPSPHHSLIALPAVKDARGALTFAEEGRHIPFIVRRIFLLHHLPVGVARGGHAHRQQHQLLLMAAGAATVVVDNGAIRESVTLSNPGQGLYCPAMLWLELENFSEGAVCLCLVSGPYDEGDYISDAAEFLRLVSR